MVKFSYTQPEPTPAPAPKTVVKRASKPRVDWKAKYEKLESRYAILNTQKRELEARLMDSMMRERDVEDLRDVFRFYIAKNKRNSKMARRLFKTITGAEY